jgi:hypothetical protein
MRVHSFKWFKKNCVFYKNKYYYDISYKGGCMPLKGIDLCGKKVVKIGNRYKVPEGVKIDDIIEFEFTFMPEWFFKKEKGELEIE